MLAVKWVKMDTLVNGQQMCESVMLLGSTFFAMSKVSTQEISFRFNWMAAFWLLGHLAVGPLDAEQFIPFAATHSFQISNGAKPNRHPFNTQFFVHDFVLNKTIRGANAPMMPISSPKGKKLTHNNNKSSKCNSSAWHLETHGTWNTHGSFRYCVNYSRSRYYTSNWLH